MVFAEVHSLLVTRRLYTPENNDLLFEMLDTLRTAPDRLAAMIALQGFPLSAARSVTARL